MKVIIQPQAHYCGQCLHRAHQKFFSKRNVPLILVHHSPNDSMKFKQTSNQWKLAVESRDSFERLPLVRIKRVELYQQQKKWSFRVWWANGGRLFLADVQNDTNCQDAGAVAVVSRIAAKILAAATKEQKKKHKFTDGY